MKELEYLKIINKTLSKTSHIGDDCAYLKELGIVITHDSLVEDIHFSLKYTSAPQLAYKAIIVNLSDILAAGAVPKYITISLSLPKYIDEIFITEFYKACEDLSKEFNFEVIGGDITGGSNLFISICAIGVTENRKISSRKHAKVGDLIVTTGVHGSSAAGLFLLMKNEKWKMKNGEEVKTQRCKDAKLVSRLTSHVSLVNAHLMPSIAKDFSEEIATKTDRDYAMMDTSDGLIDALYKIAQASNVILSVDFDKIPYDKKIEKIAESANTNFKDWVFYGGEDYQLIACIDEKNINKISAPYTVIGKVIKKKQGHFVEIISGEDVKKISNLDKTFNHFKE